MASEPPCKKFKSLNGKSKELKNFRKATKVENNFFFDFSSGSFFKSLLQREYGMKTSLLKDPLSFTAQHESSLKFYSRFKSARKYNHLSSTHGAIYNIEFSPHDKYALAATAESSVLMFDPCCNKCKINEFSTKQENGVNGITFIDERIFSTCSDDSSILLWDIRNLSESFAILKGHTSWVKDMSYNPKSKTLISSAFDEKIIAWDLNHFNSDGSYSPNLILRVPYITRTKFSNDFAKMFVSTTSGCLIIFEDFYEKDFNEEIQELMYFLSNGVMSFDKIKKQFSEQSGTVHILADFPETQNDSYSAKPLVFGSIQVSPSAEYLLSRYITRGQKEWSAIHDISGSEKAYRLAGYIDEPNVAPEFIKEPSFSADGRVICSPFGNAIRILGLNQSCEEKNFLTELSFLPSHRSPVLCCKFANTKMLLGSGCMNGQVIFYEPKIF